MDFSEDFNIEIIDKKGIRKRTISIERVPYKVYQVFQRVEKEANRVRRLANEEKENSEEIQTLRDEKPEGYRAEIKALKEENRAIEKQCFAIEDAGFFDIRFEGIKLVLASNGIDENDELMDQKTWLEKIDYVTPMRLLKVATGKDLKKILAATKK